MEVFMSDEETLIMTSVLDESDDEDDEATARFFLIQSLLDDAE